MDRRTLEQLEENFKAFVAPLLDEDDTEDVSFVWEFQKFVHTKKMRVLTSEKDRLRNWKRLLLSR